MDCHLQSVTAGCVADRVRLWINDVVGVEGPSTGDLFCQLAAYPPKRDLAVLLSSLCRVA